MMNNQLSAEDLKLVTLARAARGRIESASGACVRDQDGRTYSGATVKILDREISALELAIATAVASGAKHLEAVCVLGELASEGDVTQAKSVLHSGGLIIQCDAGGEVISVTLA